MSVKIDAISKRLWLKKLTVRFWNGEDIWKGGAK